MTWGKLPRVVSWEVLGWDLDGMEAPEPSAHALCSSVSKRGITPCWNG